MEADMFNHSMKKNGAWHRTLRQSRKNSKGMTKNTGGVTNTNDIFKSMSGQQKETIRHN